MYNIIFTFYKSIELLIIFMNFVKRLSVILIFLVFLSPFLCATNIIIIAVDTLRADHLGCYGYQRNTSPNIDRFAQDAVKFSSCYTPSPLTTPGFASLLTSLPPYKHGAKRNGLSIYTNVKTLPEYLGEHKYITAAFISNWALKKKLTGLDRGFDIYDEVFTKKRHLGLFSDEGEAPKINARTFKWLNKNSKKNFFLFVHYTEPHDPYLYHEEFDFGYDKFDPSDYPEKSHFGRIKNYDTEIGFVDFYIGELLEKIKSLDLYEESLIIFLSDHGESFGEHDYYSHGRKLYNSCLHVPLLVKLPGNKKSSTVIDGNVSLEDIPLSILSLVGLKNPEWMEGEDIFEDHSNRVLFFEAYKERALFNKGKGFRLRVKPLRYGMLNAHTKLIFDTKYEAYNLEEDRFESKNIYKNPDKKFKTLSNTLVKHIIEIQKYIQLSEKYFKQNSSLTKKELDKLKALGYIKD